MKARNLAAICILNLLGIALLLSWYLPEGHGFWFGADKNIFYFFNDLLTQSRVYLYLVALTNLRAFDVVGFVAMLSVFYGFYRRMNAEGRRYMFCMGVAMLVSAVIVKQFDNIFACDRLSPTVFFQDANRVSVLSGWPAKDASGTSFPSDHGMMLLIFASFMLRYFGFAALPRCAAIIIVFSLPRIMGGAHWFSDSAVGALAYIFIIMSWILLTPASDKFIAWLARRVPRKYFQSSGTWPGPFADRREK